MIDTHCHIDEEAFEPDREEVIARQQQSGVQAMIVPGVNVASINSVMEVCHVHPGYCYPALGLHPEDVKADWREQLATVEAAIRAHRDELVAIGEIGLDYYWDKTFKEEQKEVLRRQLLLARELNLPVILHNREATEDILTIVKEVGGRGVFHCYSGSKETAEIILKMGFYLGIGGVLTFKNSKLGETLKELNQSSITNHQLPITNRLLLETDAPYMAPTPHRGERNESRFMALVAERLAQVLNVSVDEIIEATSANARQLFGIK
ncbi:MAG: TatD family hydrolase [Bacteroidales bacterium]|nr:TatD family hydrolase [Bacteroidales bacterium]MDY6407000.1 TatD family hydrolase [Bacteroidales bacterium]